MGSFLLETAIIFCSCSAGQEQNITDSVLKYHLYSMSRKILRLLVLKVIERS